MTNPFVAVHRAVWRAVSDSVRSFRRQAPGARMIGEFAVKHAVSEAGKRLNSGTQTPVPSHPDKEPPGDAPAA